MGTFLGQVDAFTNRPFSGNPAAVCVLSEPQDDDWMQSVAAEMNLSETAFLHPERDGYRLRWFTPTVEVPLCGHATLASAHVLWEGGYLDPREIAWFYTRSGLLIARNEGDWIELDFPTLPEMPSKVPPGLMEALGLNEALYVGQCELGMLIQVASEGSVRSLQPDFRALLTAWSGGVIVTSRSADARYDFVSRFFAPGAGVPEDPVTGSAHCCLGPFWGERLGKKELTGYQASARSGVVKVRLRGGRTMLLGQAVTVLRGMLFGRARSSGRPPQAWPWPERSLKEHPYCP